MRPGSRGKLSDIAKWKRGWLMEWFLATIVGGTMGWLVTAVLATFTFGVGLLAAGTIVGLSVGWAQKRVLAGLELRGVGESWLFRTVVGATLCWVLVVLLRAGAALIDRALITHPLLPLIAFLVGGFTLGVTQGRSWGYAKGTALWTLANGLGAGIGALLGIAVAQVVVPFYTEAMVFSFMHAVYVFVAGSLATSILALATATALQTVALVLTEHKDPARNS